MTAGRAFRRDLLRLILLTWVIPPIIGLAFLVLVVEMFTVEQLAMMLVVPPLNIYVVAAVVVTVLYFRRFARPIEAHLDGGPAGPALARARRFPVDFWAIFLLYLGLAPVAVMASASLGTDFRPSGIDWFRIELVSLIVSIIVGLPIFFMVIDLFGRALGPSLTSRAHVTIKIKVFLVAALVPLLIDTMLVQYYWTKTGYFNTETFFVWLFLELLAVAGAMMAVKSFGQSLGPLESVTARDDAGLDPGTLVPQSTDELGVITEAYRELLVGLEQQRELVEIKNRVLRCGTGAAGTRQLCQAVVDTAAEVVGADVLLLATTTEHPGELEFMASSTSAGEPTERLSVSETPLINQVLRSAEVLESRDLSKDCPAVLHQRFGCQSALVSPLLVEGLPIGVLIAGYAVASPETIERDRLLCGAIVAESAARIQLAVFAEERAALEHKLLQAQRMESIGRLAGGIAHDFNNILTAIVAGCSLVKMTVTEVRTLKDVDTIEQSAERAAKLTRQLLAFSRRQLLTPEVLQINTVVLELESMLRRLIPSSISIVLELDDGLEQIRADRSQVEQVILNLVVNARDAMLDGGSITIATHRGGATGVAEDWVGLVVSDTGSGITSEALPHIFEPFFTTKAEASGTGLGLATVHGVVSQSGGTIDVESSPEGTRFTVCFPALAEDDVPSRQRPQTIEPSVDRQSATLLVVEDDANLRRMVAELLSSNGFDVICAPDGEAALGLIDEHMDEIDLMLSDVVMPGMKGPELALEVAKRVPGVRILLMSGYADEKTLEAVRETGLPLLRKPFSMPTLLGAIDKALAEVAELELADRGGA